MDPTRPHQEKATEATGHFASRWIEDYGDVLYSYALARLGGDSNLAEDLVQEALLAGLEGFANFRHDSSVQTWLIAILRYKIIDHIRQTRRLPEQSLDVYFTGHGSIRDAASWQADAVDSMLRDEFRAALDNCLRRLTAPVYEAFLCCVMDDLDPAEACQLLGISAANLSVRLHRARLQLRKCLQENWFRQET